MFARLTWNPRTGFAMRPVHDFRPADYVHPDFRWYVIKTMSDFDAAPQGDDIVLAVCQEAIREWFDSHLQEWPGDVSHILFLRRERVEDMPAGDVPRVSDRLRLIAEHQRQ